MQGELDPAEAASAYRAELDTHFGEGGVPRMDIVLLGLGEDGHAASLFPGTDAVKRGDELVVENYVPLKDSWRLTFTYPLINGARRVFFLVTEERKAGVVKEVVESMNSRLPASAVRPISGQLDWYLDQAAASHLTANS
jgi:6-phosphogluconolactonase